MNEVPNLPVAMQVNPLQRLWLREIGMEKLWLRAAQPPPTVVVVAAESPVAPAVDPAPTLAAASAKTPVAQREPAHSAPPRRPMAPEVAIKVEPLAANLAQVASADLDGLREMVLACTACGLCEGRRHAVFGTGGRPTRWLVVGEAPGEQEDRQGLPFVGRSGQLLDAMLAAVGASRDRDVFIANVIKCRPPGNRNPKPEEIAACSPYLMRQIALLNPDRILVLGRFAAQTLLGTDATIGSLRGRVHSWKTEAGRAIPVVVSYHPAYLLRSPVEKSRAWQDLRLAAGLAAAH